HLARLGLDADDELPWRMPTDLDELDARGEGVFACDEGHLIPLDRLTQRIELLALCRGGELEAPAERAGPELELVPRDGDLGLGEVREVSDVVVVRVTDDDVVDLPDAQLA